MLLLEVLCGVVLGFVLGLIPNIHINLIGYVFSLFGVFVFFKENFYFFFSLCVSQTLTSIIPSFIFYTQTQDVLFSPFLGQTPTTPSETKALLLLSFLAFLLGGIFSVLFLPFFYLLFLLFSDFYFLIFLILLLSLTFLIFQEKENSFRLIVLAIIIFSGTLGIFTLKFNFFFKEPLIPCVFGLFALPSILLILFSEEKEGGFKSKVVQEIMCFKQIVYLSFLGTLFSSTIAIFPSLSPGLAMTFANTFKENKSSKETVVLFSSILSSVLLIYFFLAVVFNKSRIGFISFLQINNILPKVVFADLLLLAFVFLIVVGLTVTLAYFCLDSIFIELNKLDKKTVLFFVLMFSLFIVFVFSGMGGLFLVVVSGGIGFLPIVYNKNRLALMSYLILPTILFFV